MNPYVIESNIPMPPRQHYPKGVDDPLIVETLLKMRVGDSMRLGCLVLGPARDKWHKASRRMNMRVAFRDVPEIKTKPGFNFESDEPAHTRVWLVYRPARGQQATTN